MKAIIVPGITDLNKGDQALVWESCRLVSDCKNFDDIYILSNGDTPMERELLCLQSEQRGYKILKNILKHPRRGKHNSQQHIKESKGSVLNQVINASLDFLSRKFLLLICKSTFLIKHLYSRDTFQTVMQFKSCDTVFVKGGGFIHSYGEKAAPYLIWFFLFYVRLAKRLGKKVVFLPNSFGPFDGFTVKKQVKVALSKLDLLYAREKVSARKLKALLNIKVPVEMDLGFFLRPASKSKSLELLEKYGLSQGDKIIGITVRPWRFPGKNNTEQLYNKYLSSIGALIRYVIPLGFKVALCNQSIGPNSHEDDRNAIKDLLSKYNHKNVIWINENLPCDELKALYSTFYFFIGTRFHSVIFSMTSLVPSIAIGYGGNKARGIMSDFDLNDYVVQIDDITSKNVLEMLNSALTNYDEIKRKLKDSIAGIEDSRNRIIEEINRIHHT